MPGTVHGQRHLRALAFHRQMKRIQGWRGTARHGIQGQGGHTGNSDASSLPFACQRANHHAGAIVQRALAILRAYFLVSAIRQFGVSVHFPGCLNAHQHL